LEKLIRWYQGYTTSSWRVDETYVNVCGEWLYLFRAIDSHGRTIDFYLSQRRNATAAQRFLAKAVRSRRDWGPAVINTDRNPAYGEAIRKLKTAKILDASVDPRQVKYLNNQLEADHGAIKRRIRSMLGFKSAKTAYATLKGIEAMSMIRKLQCILLKPGITGETHFFNKLFGIYV
jgi:transposase, IS6 family